ncbi:MAG: translation initiation factor IF-2 [Patescibacteria group bacterium]
MASETKQSRALPRPPIVAVLGHVDHGKTSLLDYIRKTNVASREAGGITQSIGAYEIEHQGKRITFIDTPGHEAFSKMRSRGATAADLAVLVVAAEEGVKPQTKESIDILKATNTPFVVAITKADKPGADIEKVKSELMAAGVLLEGYGGQVSFQPVSSKSGEHIDDLLDLILLTAEMENLTYDPDAPASGYILETAMDRQRGLHATLIVKNGTLRFGDAIATVSTAGKVKILEDFLGKAAKEITPSAPALVVGFESMPTVGEEFVVGGATNEREATRKEQVVIPAEGEDKSVRIILKAGDAGSLEALGQIIRALPGEPPARIIAESVGDVGDNDVKMAISSKATILAFTSRTDKAARNLAEANKVQIIEAKVIYELVKTAEDLMHGALKPKAEGVLEVLAIFNQTKLEKQVVGGKVTDGAVKNRVPFEIERAGAIVGRGRIVNLQQQKKETPSVGAGNEAGLLVSSDIAILKGDRLLAQ